MKKFIFFFILALNIDHAQARPTEDTTESTSVVTNSFWDNWYVQLGMDMWLQNPYGSDFSKVFPNGRTFGIEVGLGKWVTPEFGLRGNVNWENGIVKNNHASWIKEGSKSYLTLSGDFLLNLTNLFGQYKVDKKWNASLFARAGAFLDFCKNGTVGSPLVGAGVDCSYRLNERWKIVGDVSYQVSSSALGYLSGEGSGSNGYFDINFGIQMNLGNNKFYKVSDNTNHYKHAVVTNSIWDNWFVQFGLGMTLLNGYGCNFSYVFPNGKTIGLNLGLGKWLTPEYGVRLGLNWQNGIIGNNHLSWLDRKDDPGSNHKAGGFVSAYGDVFFNLHNLFLGYDENRTWSAIVYPRAGLCHNFDVSDSSPMIGLGTEQTFRLSDRVKLYADISYQVSSGGCWGKEHQSSHLNGGSNGWFDINVGIQYDLGLNKWYKPGEYRTTTQYEGGHNWSRFIVNTSASVAVAFGAKTALKAMIKEERPDHSDNKSFPSGHAAMAFAAARSIDKEFRKDNIWIPIAGYAAATAVGIERIANKHHHWYDVVAGAGVGIGAAELTWWLSDKLLGSNSNIAVGSSGNTIDVAYNF